MRSVLNLQQASQRPRQLPSPWFDLRQQTRRLTVVGSTRAVTQAVTAKRIRACNSSKNCQRSSGAWGSEVIVSTKNQFCGFEEFPRLRRTGTGLLATTWRRPTSFCSH